MPDYANGKIYKIVGEDGSTYYGSTTMSLYRRMNCHRNGNGKKRTTAYYKIISKMDWEMILVENYPCESRTELERREGTYIRENPCVNRLVAGRTDREYYQDNKEEIKDKAKKSYKDNPERRREINAKWRRKNPWSSTKNSRWIRSFGDPRNTNCVQRCDYMLFQ